MTIRFCDEFDGGIGWIADELLGRTSHALVVDGGVWLVDPVAAPEAEERVRVLYGGSMKPDNAAELLALPDCDGGLIGGASLKPDDFLAIVDAAASSSS